MPQLFSPAFFNRLLISLVNVGILGVLGISSAEAQSCLDPNVVVGLGQVCSSQVDLTSSNATVSVGNGGSINTNSSGINNAGTVTSLTNDGTINASSPNGVSNSGYGINNSGDITNLTNSGTISGYGDVNRPGTGYGINHASGTITTLNNSGTIYGSGYSIHYSGTINTLDNNGVISAVNDGVIGNGTIHTLTNKGSISAAINAVYNSGSIGVLDNATNGTIAAVNGIYSDGTINTLTNSGTITGNGGNGGAIYNQGTITTVTNNGTITDSTSIYGDPLGGLVNYGGTITAINNNDGAFIFGSGTGTSGIYNTGATSAITNVGTIHGSDYGITNQNTIATIVNTGSIIGAIVDINNTTIGIQSPIANLYNAQGAGNSNGALTFTGSLPQNYGIILGTNDSIYGKLIASNITNWDVTVQYDNDENPIYTPSGTTNFSVYNGRVKSNKYTAVLSGITADYLTPSTLSGSYISGSNTYAYQLSLESGSDNIWDLLFPNYISGPSTVDTQQSLVNTAQSLQHTFTILNTALTNSLSYDCTVFDKHNVCMSGGFGNTTVSSANRLNITNALLIVAYRPHLHFRIGAYADKNLSVNHAGSTVNLSNNTPLIGLFGVWNQRLDGTGTEVKLSAAYGQKSSMITRQIVDMSEAGSGSAPINSQGAQVTAKYSFGVMKNLLVLPYAGVRYTKNNMNSYTEAPSTTVTAPLTYSTLNTNTTTALAGVGASYQFIPQASVFASAGIETDAHTNNGTYSASGLTGITPINFNINPVKTRPIAILGAYYDVRKNQRVGITGMCRQEPYHAVSTTTLMATYTIGI